jgi:hypothetical protein
LTKTNPKCGPLPPKKAWLASAKKKDTLAYPSSGGCIGERKEEGEKHDLLLREKRTRTDSANLIQSRNRREGRWHELFYPRVTVMLLQ